MVGCSWSQSIHDIGMNGTEVRRLGTGSMEFYGKTGLACFLLAVCTTAKGKALILDLF
jgi:hypothetical protein